MVINSKRKEGEIMDKKIYESPEMQVILMDKEDVIKTSDTPFVPYP